MVLRQTRTKDSEEKAAALRNAQNAACGSCGFCATYLLLNHTVISVHKGDEARIPRSHSRTRPSKPDVTGSDFRGALQAYSYSRYDLILAPRCQDEQCRLSGNEKASAVIHSRVRGGCTGMPSSQRRRVLQLPQRTGNRRLHRQR
jgi:hypothetical protein